MPQVYVYTYTRWWFQTFLYFHPYLGKWSQLTNIFSYGLKPHIFQPRYIFYWFLSAHRSWNFLPLSNFYIASGVTSLDSFVNKGVSIRVQLIAILMYIHIYTYIYLLLYMYILSFFIYIYVKPHSKLNTHLRWSNKVFESCSVGRFTNSCAIMDSHQGKTELVCSNYSWPTCCLCLFQKWVFVGSWFSLSCLEVCFCYILLVIILSFGKSIPILKIHSPKNTKAWSLGIQSPCQMMIGVYNHLRNARYLASMLPFSEGDWIPRDSKNQQNPVLNMLNQRFQCISLVFHWLFDQFCCSFRSLLQDIEVPSCFLDLRSWKGLENVRHRWPCFNENIVYIYNMSTYTTGHEWHSKLVDTYIYIGLKYDVMSLDFLYIVYIT